MENIIVFEILSFCAFYLICENDDFSPTLYDPNATRAEEKNLPN